MKLEEVKKSLEKTNALLTDVDIETLYKYASKVPENGKIVDIGTAEGASAIVMTLASHPSVKVYTIDPHYNEKFVSRIIELGIKGRIEYCVQTSADFSEVWYDKIDLLFIDGIHNYQGVMDDFNWLGTHVKGHIIFHDYLLYRNTVGKAVDDLIESGRIKFIEQNDGTYQDRIIGNFVATHGLG